MQARACLLCLQSVPLSQHLNLAKYNLALFFFFFSFFNCCIGCRCCGTFSSSVYRDCIFMAKQKTKQKKKACDFFLWLWPQQEGIHVQLAFYSVQVAAVWLRRWPLSCRSCVLCLRCRLVAAYYCDYCTRLNPPLCFAWSALMASKNIRPLSNIFHV